MRGFRSHSPCELLGRSRRPGFSRRGLSREERSSRDVQHCRGQVEDWKQGVLLEFPSAMAVFALVMVWVTWSRSFASIRKGSGRNWGSTAPFFKKWRSPQWLVWPTIVSGLFLIVDAGRVSEVSLNVFKFLMAIYTIQGLSISELLF